MKPNQMKMFKYIAGLNLLMAPLTLAQTGDRGGNGGDAVVCKDGSIRMLDTVDSIRLGHIPQYSSAATLREKVKEYLNRQRDQSIALADELTPYAEMLVDDLEKYERTGVAVQANVMLADGQLLNVPDEGFTYIPLNCKIEQLIFRSKNPMPTERKFSIRRDIWLKMSLDERAVAVMHEAIYSYLIENERENSTAARWYNGLLISNAIATYDLTKLVQEMALFKFPEVEWSRNQGDFAYDPKGSIFDSSGRPVYLTEAKFKGDSKLVLLPQNIKINLVRGAHFKNGVLESADQIWLDQPLPVLGSSVQALTRLTHVEFKDGLFYRANFPGNIHLSLKTGEAVPVESNSLLMQGGGYSYTRKQAKEVKKGDAVSFSYDSTITRNIDGTYTVFAQKNFVYLDSVMLIPLMNIVAASEGMVYYSRQKPARITLDSNLYPISVTLIKK